MAKLSLLELQAVDLLLHKFNEIYRTKDFYKSYKLVFESKGKLFEASAFQWSENSKGIYYTVGEFSPVKRRWDDDDSESAIWLRDLMSKFHVEINRDPFRERRDFYDHPEVLLEYILEFLRQIPNESTLSHVGTPYIYDVTLLESKLHFDSYRMNPEEFYTIIALKEA